MEAAFVFLLLCFVIGVTVIAFDVVPLLKDILGRRHIGSLSNDAWQSAAEQKAAYWLRHGLPVVPRVAGRRLTVIDRLRGEYRAASIGFWQSGAVLAAVNETAPSAAAAYIESTAQTPALFRNCRADAAALAYAMLQNPQTDPDALRPHMDELARQLLDVYHTHGSIPYAGDASVRFVDTVGLVCPFLASYALIYDVPEALQASLDVIREYAAYGLHPDFHLPVHCFRVPDHAPLGIYGWGRGSGWWAVGLADTFAVLQMQNGYEEEKLFLLQELLSFCDAIVPFQSESGAFDRNLFCASGADSSATAMLAMALAYAGTLTQRETYISAAERAMRYLYSVTRTDGTVDYSQGDTMGVGFYSQASIVVPAAQGFALRAYHLLKELRSRD